jgi:hypothetical protein
MAGSALATGTFGATINCRVVYWSDPPPLLALLRPADQDREGRIIGLERTRLQWA